MSIKHLNMDDKHPNMDDAKKMKKQKDITGSSHVQMEAENELREILQNQLEINEGLQPRTIIIEGKVHIRVDAATLDNSVVAEIFARQGKLLDGQQKKLARDILKLAVLKQKMPSSRVILAFANIDIENHLTGASWVAFAVEKFGIELKNLDKSISPELRMKIILAQNEQAKNRQKLPYLVAML